jgi:hypothetical protein
MGLSPGKADTMGKHTENGKATNLKEEIIVNNQPEVKPETILTADAVKKVAEMLNPTMALDTLHNTLIEAVALANKTTATEPELVMALGGHACGGWRKPMLQTVAAAFGLIPCLTIASPAPGHPEGQQAAFYGNGSAAKVAAQLYTKIYDYTNINGNKLLRDARADGHKAGKSGSAGDRLQENVYNEFAAKVLGAIAVSAPVEAPETVKTAYAASYASAPAKGGIVFSGAYNTALYDGKLAIVTKK